MEVLAPVYSVKKAKWGGLASRGDRNADCKSAPHSLQSACGTTKGNSLRRGRSVACPGLVVHGNQHALRLEDPLGVFFLQLP